MNFSEAIRHLCPHQFLYSKDAFVQSLYFAAVHMHVFQYAVQRFEVHIVVTM
jgi:hypothetical protein